MGIPSSQSQAVLGCNETSMLVELAASQRQFIACDGMGCQLPCFDSSKAEILHFPDPMRLSFAIATTIR